jgi:4-amino-4-deoxy-L-arabinose transferase-like glycosyltransferase
MVDLSPSDAPQTGATPFRHPLLRWLWTYRVPILFALLMAALLPMRDLWAPDEPDFAQCVREMRERGSWLLPYLNGRPYAEKPILFYWLMKICAIGLERITGGAGFTHGVAAWALRLPSALAASGFLFAFRRWTARFLDADSADLAAMILAVVPIWMWQAQFIQIDMVFAALLAWSWLSWLAGYLLLRGHAQPVRVGEHGRWFLCAYAALALAFLAKGPLALALSAPLALAFLAWQGDLGALGRIRLGTGLAVVALVLLPWYLAAGLRGGAAYAYEMVVHQNFTRALQAWDHVQPPWKYAEYLAGDGFPWSLLLPVLAAFLWRARRGLAPACRFAVLAFALPVALLSLSQSKQSKYILMVYPFLALLLAVMVRSFRAQARSRGFRLWFAGLLTAGTWMPALAALAVVGLHAGGHRLQAQIAPYLGPLRLVSAVLVLGALAVTLQLRRGDDRRLVGTVALTLGLAFLLVGTWGFRRLDPQKSYRDWTAAVEPLIAGRQVYYWQGIRSGVMVYTDHLMPEIRSRAELDRLVGPEQRLVAQRGEWDNNAWGMDPEARRGFEVLLQMPVGGGEFLLLRRKSLTQ